MASDLLSTLRVYLSKLSDGENSPAEMVAALNTWLRDSGESIKVKIEDEVERSVKKMGFVKQADFDRLAKEVDALRNATKASKPSATKASKPSATKASKPSATKASKPSATKTSKPSATKKAVLKKSATSKAKK